MKHGILMEFSVFGRNGPVLIFLLGLALVSSISFADSPPPPPSQVTVHLVNNGVNETSIGQIVYHCNDTNANEEKNISLACNAGTCVNDPYTIGSECRYFPAGYFTYAYQGQDKSSERFNATKPWQRYYEYRLDVQTGRITPISASNGKDNSLCSTAFLMFAIVMGCFTSNRG
jgi:hypothetical protein